MNCFDALAEVDRFSGTHGDKRVGDRLHALCEPTGFDVELVASNSLHRPALKHHVAIEMLGKWLKPPVGDERIDQLLVRPEPGGSQIEMAAFGRHREQPATCAVSCLEYLHVDAVGVQQ